MLFDLRFSGQACIGTLFSCCVIVSSSAVSNVSAFSTHPTPQSVPVSLVAADPCALCREILLAAMLNRMYRYSEEAILASGVSTAFFPHGVGHSLGLDVHDVPSASKPQLNNTIKLEGIGHIDFYKYLRLRLPLETNMIVVRDYTLLQGLTTDLGRCRRLSQASTSHRTSSLRCGTRR